MFSSLNEHGEDETNNHQFTKNIQQSLLNKEVGKDGSNR